MKTKITVCILTYNRASYLREAITSVLKQSYTDFKLHIFDNCSTDNTRDVVESFHDKRITFLSTSKNIGFERNFIRCFETTKTNYLITLGDDDILLPNALSVLVSLLESHPNCSIGRSAGYRFFKRSDQIDIIDQSSTKLRTFRRGDVAISHALLYNLGSFTGLIIRKSCATKLVPGKGMLGGLIEPLFTILRRGGFVYTPQILFGVRCHENLAYKIYEKSSYIEELYPTYHRYIRNKKYEQLAKEIAMNAAISDLYNMRVFGGFGKVVKEIKLYAHLMPAIKFKPRFIISACFALVFPSPFIQLIKKMMITIKAMQNYKKYSYLFT